MVYLSTSSTIMERNLLQEKIQAVLLFLLDGRGDEKVSFLGIDSISGLFFVDKGREGVRIASENELDDPSSELFLNIAKTF